jgi:Zn-dependent oligopeptidase
VDTGEGLTTDLIKKIMLVEDFMPAWTFTGHTTNALFDLEIHGKNILKYAGKKGLLSKIHNSFTRKYINVHGFKGRDYPSSFAHMMHGYESKYYSYIVSKVYAQDAWGQLIGKYKYNGNTSAVYDGVTFWNWMKEKKGIFHITITLLGEDDMLFQQALQESIVILEKIYLSHTKHRQKKQKVN